jgi:hypothetical protein
LISSKLGLFISSKVGLLDVEYFIKIVGGGNGGHPYVSF